MITFKVVSGSFKDGVWTLTLDSWLGSLRLYPFPTSFNKEMPGLPDEVAMEAIKRGEITFYIGGSLQGSYPDPTMQVMRPSREEFERQYLELRDAAIDLLKAMRDDRVRLLGLTQRALDTLAKMVCVKV